NFPPGWLMTGKTRPSPPCELKEETGYVGTVAFATPPTYNTPGLSSETVRQYLVDIDENLPENKNPVPELEGSEHIEVLVVPHESLHEFLQEEFDKGNSVDSKVVAYALGLQQG
ncbi:MAG: hypothetical protein JXR97_12535, partial [Planctomycetes bacterium]|nr:hypothetical protein [Planctomycetota bacterium]